MVILEDKAQKEDKHSAKHRYWESHGHEIIRVPLPVGDYILMNDKVQDVLDRKTARGIEPKKMDFLGTYNVCVDSKFSIQELVSDICGKQHERFRDECILAQNNGVKLYVVVQNDYEVVYSRDGRTIENYTITDLKDLHRWVNPRLWIFRSGKQAYPKATRGSILQKACYSMEQKYGCSFVFVSTRNAGEKILSLLTQNY